MSENTRDALLLTGIVSILFLAIFLGVATLTHMRNTDRLKCIEIASHNHVEPAGIVFVCGKV